MSERVTQWVREAAQEADKATSRLPLPQPDAIERFARPVTVKDATDRAGGHHQGRGWLPARLAGAAAVAGLVIALLLVLGEGPPVQYAAIEIPAELSIWVESLYTSGDYIVDEISDHIAPRARDTSYIDSVLIGVAEAMSSGDG
jgi:hypothetical protein